VHVFTHQAMPMRVVFGPGVVSGVGDEVDALGLRRVLVLCSLEQAELGQRVADVLGDRAAGLLAEATMHVPAEVGARARDTAARLGADGAVAVGGGSTIGLGKAIALDAGLPVVAVPTTYAGSEMTPVWGVTEQGRKRTGRDPRVLPRSVLYDPELTRSLPAALSATSGLNALAHAVEGLYAPDATPIVSLMAQEGARALAAALPRVVADGTDLEARSEAQYGAWLCGAVLGATSMSLHHKLCHTLGGTLGLPHAPTHAVVLPHALAYNAPAAPRAVAALTQALGVPDDPARALWELAGRLNVPRALRDLGMAETEIPRIVERVVQEPYANPREVTADGVRALVEAAWRGDPPTGTGTRASVAAGTAVPR
jgi:maleylacetate reductase